MLPCTHASPAPTLSRASLHSPNSEDEAGFPSEKSCPSSFAWAPAQTAPSEIGCRAPAPW